MGNLFQRVFWAGLGLSPAVPAVVAPVGLGQPLMAVIATALGSLAALLAAIAGGGSAVGRHGARLLRRSSLRTPPPDLPDPKTRRDMIAVALRGATIADAGVPPGRKTAVARVLVRVMQDRGRMGADCLSDEDTVEMVLLLRLLRAGPTEAGALAQLFQRPDIVLDLRDEVNRMAALREAYDRDVLALDATRALWRTGRRDFGDLPDALQALAVPDPDLWHAVVRHDGAGPAALWCVSQPSCERATLALFMAAVLRDDALCAAAARGDRSYVETVHAVLRRWNAGGYANAWIRLTPDDLPPDPARALTAMLDRLARQTGKPRWSEPCGLFSSVDGVAARDRGHWCLDSARLLRAPDAAAYLEAHLFGSAPVMPG